MVAAQLASRRYAHREAMSVLEHARDLLPKVAPQGRPALETEVLARIAEARYTLGEMQQAIDGYQLLAERAAGMGDRAAQAAALIGMSHPAAFVDPRRAIAACEQAAKLAAGIDDPHIADQSKLLAACWRIFVNGWREKDGRARDKGASRLLKSASGIQAYERLLYARSLVYCSEYLEAMQNAEQAFADLSGGDRLWAAPSALYIKPSALGHLGRLGETQRTLANAFELAEKDNNPAGGTPLHRVLVAMARIRHRRNRRAF